MVAAPLGKKSNISGFYYDVLNPILQDFMIKMLTLKTEFLNIEKPEMRFLNNWK